MAGGLSRLRLERQRAL